MLYQYFGDDSNKETKVLPKCKAIILKYRYVFFQDTQMLENLQLSMV